MKVSIISVNESRTRCTARLLESHPTDPDFRKGVILEIDLESGPLQSKLVVGAECDFAITPDA
jgi:hypothetical protein